MEISGSSRAIMRLNLVILAFLIHSVRFASANYYSYGYKLGRSCKTAFTNITYACDYEDDCICKGSKRMSWVYCAMTHTDNEKDLLDTFKGLSKTCPDLTLSDYEKDMFIARLMVREVNFTDLFNKTIDYPIILPKENFDFANDCVMSSFYHLEICDELAGGMLGFWAIVVIIQAVVNFARKYSPRLMNAFNSKFTKSLQKHYSLPASFGYTHSSISSFLGYEWMTPTRRELFIMIFHSAVNLAIYFRNYPLVPNDWYTYENMERQLQDSLGWRSGVFAVAHIPLLYLFAGRNNFLMWITGWSIDRFNLFHRFLARWMMIHTIIHAVAYAVDYGGTPDLADAWHQPYWQHGFAATIFGAVMIVHGIYYLRSRFYEIFLITHIILAIAFTITTWYHLYFVAGGTQYMYATFAIWGVDRAARVIRIIYSGVRSNAETKLYPDGTIKMIVSYSNLWKFKPGQFVFIHVMRRKYFYQSHPFSIVQSPLPENEGKLVLLYKARTGFTKDMYEELEKQATCSLNYRILIDGPYGEAKPVENYDNIVLVSGGIGITGVYSYAAVFKPTDIQKRISLYWCIADARALDWFEDELGYLGQDARFDVRVYVKPPLALIERASKSLEEKDTPAFEVKKAPSIVASDISTDGAVQRLSEKGIQIIYTRIQAIACVEEEVKASKGSVAVVCCGPGSLNDDVRFAVVRSVDKTESRVDYFEESFSW